MTVFELPIIRSVLSIIARATAKLLGWKFDSSIFEALDKHQKAMVVGAPHTSNWDFPLMLMTTLALKMPARWLGKHTLFWGPLGPIMRFLGGIPIDRRSRFNSVEQISEKFAVKDKMTLVIAPEGTRSAVSKWRTGFYFMAQSAQVPMVFAYLDYAKRTVGVLAVECAEADIDKDEVEKKIAGYQALFSDVTGKNPQNYIAPDE